uniref:cytochrome-c oxidase n=1 Tax=Echinostoma hortense TaxID=48216 RepID=A0A0M5KHB3_9TREM|nr:cytochrome c oxidase subunit 2 [Echinostoma hortense]
MIMFSTNVLYLDLICFIILVCAFIPAWILLVLGWQICSLDIDSAHNNESDIVEFFWTVVPSATVMIMCYLNVNCMTLEIMDSPTSVVKVVGHQWYWNYDLGAGVIYDSIMGAFVDSVNKPLRLIGGVVTQVLITSADVIHSFSVPALNLKLDAIPGRLNGVSCVSNCFGIYTGYCTELCGAGHAYMPVVIEVVMEQNCF